MLVFDELPERAARSSAIEEQLAKIQADPEKIGKAICIAQYGEQTAATAAANILRKRHGKPEANGWWFGTRKVTVPGETDERAGLFVRFDPARIVPGEAEKHTEEKAAREKANREKAAQKKASQGNGDKAAKAKTAASK